MTGNPSLPDDKKLLLVVDDVPSNIQIVQSILKAEYKIRVATNGEKALELARLQPLPDLILLDVMMPGMDGFEVCERLKAAPETRDIPVIFLTALSDATDEARGLEVGAVDYIRKPFSPAIVQARVRTHLLLRESQEELNRQVEGIHHELEMARQIQLSILPGKPPSVSGLEISACYSPMTAIAGDFYDYLVIDEKRVGILVADVSGHGAPSALIASMLRIALGEQVSVADDPGKVLSGLNAALCGKFDHHFVTAAYAYLDTGNRTLRYGGAGHPPLALWMAANQQARSVEENGLVLAQFPDEAYSAIELTFEPGDRALLYTDGVPECPSPDQRAFGVERLLSSLTRKIDSSTSSYVEDVLDELSSWSKEPRGLNQHDDITVVAISSIE